MLENRVRSKVNGFCKLGVTNCIHYRTPLLEYMCGPKTDFTVEIQRKALCWTVVLLKHTHTVIGWDYYVAWNDKTIGG
jgi:hypothetical protein